MGYVGGRLAPWFDTSPTKKFLNRAAEAGGDRMAEVAALNTPVRTSHLRESWRTKAVVVMTMPAGEVAYVSGAETFVEYAPYVEWGTGLWGPKHAKYPIRPKNPDGWLRWIDPHTGLPVFAKLVMHPGSPGNHMMAIAANVAEFEYAWICQLALMEWADEVEGQNHTGLGHRRV